MTFNQLQCSGNYTKDIKRAVWISLSRTESISVQLSREVDLDFTGSAGLETETGIGDDHSPFYSSTTELIYLDK